jgi:tetratricopeptide (TPR) repeat protein
MGQADLAIKAGRRAVVLDPLNRWAHQYLGVALLASRRYTDALAALAEAVALDPTDADIELRGKAYYLLGDFQGARSSCEKKAESEYAQLCLAFAYYRLGQHADAEAMLAKLRASMGDAGAFQYAEIYAQWGRPTQALESLDTAMHLRSPSLEWVKTDALLDPLRKEPRFQAIERELKFPD